MAAEAGLCANEQGSEKFWKLHDAMFEDQSKLAKGDLQKTAKRIGLTDAFLKCLESGKYKAQIESDKKDGMKAGVKSTPTFFVNGKMINGAQPFEVFSELIDSEMKL